MSAAIEILVRKLDSTSASAEHASEALVDQAYRKDSDLDSYVPRIATHLKHGNMNVRAALSQALGNIKTKAAVSALVNAIKTTPTSELQKECGYSCWSHEPLYFWLTSGIAEEQNSFTAQALVSIVAEPSLPDGARTAAMKQLSYFDLDEINLKFPPGIVEIVTGYADSSDSEIAEGAIKLLGRM